MRVTVSDKDLFSFKDSFGAKEEIGRVLVKIQPVVKIEPSPLTQWYHLGDGDWGAAEGCGKGCGRYEGVIYFLLLSHLDDNSGALPRIQLRLQYRGFHNLEVGAN